MTSDSDAGDADTVQRTVFLPRPRTDTEIKQLARWITQNTLLSYIDVPKTLLGMVFMPITLGMFAGWPEEDFKKIHLYGVVGVHKTLDRSVNGLPIFVECGLCLNEDFIRAVVLAAEVLRAQRAILGPDPDEPRSDEES